MTNAAQVDRQPDPHYDPQTDQTLAADLRSDLPQASEQPFALKQQVAERLAAHRARRSSTSTNSAAPGPVSAEAESARRTPTRARSAAIAAAVAQRYAESPSYRAVLAEESARALHQAEAAAEVANINARAIARAQQQLLADLGDWDQPHQPVSSVPLKSALPPAQPAAVAAAILAQQKAANRAIIMPEPPPARRPDAQVATPAYTVRMYEDTGRPQSPPPVAYSIAITAAPDEEEAMLLEEEIAFRHDPTFFEASASEPLPANLIEFPRQLVAPRKARPRFAEGPLRDEPHPDSTQLRIFEVEADHISVAPAEDTAAPEWSSILLPAQPDTTFFDPLNSDFSPTLVPQPAPLSRRLMSALVDLSLVAVCVLAAIAVFVSTAVRISHTPLAMPLPLAIAGAIASLLVFGLIYHQLFFLFADATPGMRYARIALCTLTDENPTRSAMRRRLLAMSLSALPLGLGYIWAMLDEDGLGWHDRISRMYQRPY